MKKKLDSDVVDLGVALEHANAANAESQRNISLIQGNIRNVQKRFEEESRAKAVATDNLISADRRANANQNALEEARTLLEQADRNRRMVEQELADEREPERPDLHEPGDLRREDEVRAGDGLHEPRPRRDDRRGASFRGEGSTCHDRCCSSCR